MMPRTAVHGEPRRAVLLRHTCGDATHYDLMIEDFAAAPGQGLLRTWRIAEPSWRWADLGRVELQGIDAHRRDYLTYEGPLSGGRGEVTRVDGGEVMIHEWSEQRTVLEFSFRRFSGTVEMRSDHGQGWVLIVRKAAGCP